MQNQNKSWRHSSIRNRVYGANIYQKKFGILEHSIQTLWETNLDSAGRKWYMYTDVLQHQLASYMYPMNSMRLFFVTRFLTYSCIVLLCVIFLLLRNKNAILLYWIVIILNDGRYNMIHVFMISSNCFHKFNSCFLLYIFCLIKYN